MSRATPCRGPLASETLAAMDFATLLRRTREHHGLSQARLALRIGSDRSYISRVERGVVSPSFAWAERALAAMGEELELTVVRSRFDDHDPAAHRAYLALTPDERLADFLASAEVLDAFAREGESRRGGDPASG